MKEKTYILGWDINTKADYCYVFIKLAYLSNDWNNIILIDLDSGMTALKLCIL